MNNLYIAKKIKIGFQKREDTYTKKLGYVIYYDDKGKLRKETSWQSWRDKTIQDIEYDNVPTEGFVLNKGAGGKAGSWSSWNVRREVVRIWDPRNFEFEISVDNLLFILTECDCTRGKGLSGEFVYAWNGKELMLLPASCEAYKQSAQFTSSVAGKVSTKELIEGWSYKNKKMDVLIYLGKHLTFHTNSYYYSEEYIPSMSKVGIYHVFYNEKSKYLETHSGLVSLCEIVDKSCHSNFSKLYDKFEKSWLNVDNYKEFKPEKKIVEIRRDQKIGYTHETYREQPLKTEISGDGLFVKIGDLYHSCRLYSIQENKKSSRSNYYTDVLVTDYKLVINENGIKYDGKLHILPTKIVTSSNIDQAQFNRLEFYKLSIKNKKVIYLS